MKTYTGKLTAPPKADRFEFVWWCISTIAAVVLTAGMVSCRSPIRPNTGAADLPEIFIEHSLTNTVLHRFSDSDFRVQSFTKDDLQQRFVENHLPEVLIVQNDNVFSEVGYFYNHGDRYTSENESFDLILLKSIGKGEAFINLQKFLAKHEFRLKNKIEREFENYVQELLSDTTIPEFKTSKQTLMDILPKMNEIARKAGYEQGDLFVLMDTSLPQSKQSPHILNCHLMDVSLLQIVKRLVDLDMSYYQVESKKVIIYPGSHPSEDKFYMVDPHKLQSFYNFQRMLSLKAIEDQSSERQNDPIQDPFGSGSKPIVVSTLLDAFHKVGLRLELCEYFKEVDRLHVRMTPDQIQSFENVLYKIHDTEVERSEEEVSYDW